MWRTTYGEPSWISHALSKGREGALASAYIACMTEYEFNE